MVEEITMYNLPPTPGFQWRLLSTENMARTNNYVQGFLLGVITPQCPNINGDLIKAIEIRKLRSDYISFHSIKYMPLPFLWNIFTVPNMD